MVLRTVLAVVLAGVAGVLATAAAAALVVTPMLWQLAAAPSRYLIGIVLAVLVPLIYRLKPNAWGAALALLLLTLLPSLAAKLALGALIAWPTLLALNFTYALAVLVVYRVVAGSR
ncbi:MAG: hypothetical protein RLN99_09460 [Kiloniellaceae bacterium]